MGPVSVSMVTSRWNRTVMAVLALAQAPAKGKHGWWAEYSTGNQKKQPIAFTFCRHERDRGSAAKLFARLELWTSITATSGHVGSANCIELESMRSSALAVSGRPRESAGRNRSGQRVDQRLIEKKLLGEHRAGRRERSNHNVNVDDASAAPAGHHGLEGDRPA